MAARRTSVKTLYLSVASLSDARLNVAGFDVESGQLLADRLVLAGRITAAVEPAICTLAEACHALALEGASVVDLCVKPVIARATAGSRFVESWHELEGRYLI